MVNINPNLLLNQATTKSASAYNATQTDAEVESATSSGPDAKTDATMRKAVWLMNGSTDAANDLLAGREGDQYIDARNGVIYTLHIIDGYRHLKPAVTLTAYERGRGDLRAQ